MPVRGLRTVPTLGKTPLRTSAVAALPRQSAGRAGSPACVLRFAPPIRCPEWAVALAVKFSK